MNQQRDPATGNKDKCGEVPIKKWSSRIALLLLAIVGTVFAVEAILLCMDANLPHFVHTPGLSRIFRPMTNVMPGVEGESRFIVNAHGLRGPGLPKPSRDDIRILCIGGSTTECMILDEDQTWPARLNDMLQAKPGEIRRVWIGNAGKSGNNSRHNLLHAEQLLNQIPDVDTIILLLGVNDLSSRLVLDEGYTRWDLTLKETDTALYEKAFDVVPAHTPPDERPAMWALPTLRARFSRLRSTFQPAPEIEAQIQDDAGACYNMWRRYRRKARQIRTELPDLGPALVEYEQNLKAIIATARQHKVRCVFVTQPVMWREGLPPDKERLLWMGGVGNFRFEKRSHYYSTKALRAGMDLYNNKLREVCRTEVVNCIDLAAALNDDLSVYYDDCHFNQKGAERVAEIIAAQL